MATGQSGDNKALRQIYHEAEEWLRNVNVTDGEKSAYLRATAIMAEIHDPHNALTIYNAINRLFFGKRE